MPISIKEIFKSDLDPNSNEWWSQDKVDKINNNFRQLTSGGMVGPMGSQGSFGQSGYSGSLGDQGFKGSLGDKGSQGEIGKSTWVVAEGSLTSPLVSDSLHLFPNRQIPAEYATTSMKVGYPDTLYPTLTSYIGGGSTLTLNSSNWQHGTPPNPEDTRVNLKLTTYALNDDGTESNQLYNSEHRLFRLDNINTYEEGRIRTGSNGFINRIKLNPFDTYIIQGQRNGVKTDDISISVDSTTFNNQLLSQKDFTGDGDVYIKQGAQVDFVLISTDNQGNVKWVPKNQVLPSYQNGMIISIPRFVFNNTNFDLQTSYQQSPSGEPIRFTYGRGLEGGQYEGWYLCNGQKWNTQAGVNETLVPNMNQTSLDIDLNGTQQTVNDAFTPAIMGGHEMYVDASNIGGTKYDIQYSNLPFYSNDSTTQQDVFGLKIQSDDFSVSKLVYLVKLPFNNLEWEQSTALAPALQNITLTYGSTSSISCAETQTGVFRWDAPSGINLNTVWCTFGGYKLYQLTTLHYAPSGYYKVPGQSCTRYWNASTGQFTTSITCTSWTPITFNYATDISDLNPGGSPSAGGYEIDTPLFENATLIRFQTGATAPQGWYQVLEGGVFTKRRWWNGTAFEGEVINHTYVTLMTSTYVTSLGQSFAGIKPVKAATSTIACNTPSNAPSHSIYFGSSAAPFSGMWSNVGSIMASTSVKLYVHKNWATTTVEQTPLVNIANQAAPGLTGGSSNRANYLVDSSSTYDFVVGGFVYDTISHQNITANGNPNGGGTC